MEMENVLLYKMVKKIVLFLILVLVVQGMALPQKEKQKDKKATEQAKPVPFSWFIPGLNQIKGGKYFKGGLLLSAFLGSAVGAVTYNNRGNRWYEKYSNSTVVDDIVRYRKNTEKDLRKRNLFIVGIFSTWLIHIIDLKFFKSKKGGVTSEIGKNNLAVGFYYSF